MTNLEYDVLDELYFVQDYDYLKNELDIGEPVLIEVLEQLYQKDFIKCFRNPNEEIDRGMGDIKNNYKSYLYLATKKGLFAHHAD